MMVTVRLFARAKDLAGAEAVQVALPESATVADLRRQLTVQCPTLAALLTRSAIAVDDEFASDPTVLREQATVALLPPVSGG
jgi:molybdopterin synthase catalytic subunit/molybdopterin synthase sulfur carrier subunit